MTVSSHALILPYIHMPEYYNRLLVANIQNNSQTNTNLEIYIADHSHLNQLIKKIFKDIDAEGFIGKILAVNGFVGIRNRLASAFVEHRASGVFPETVNQTLIQEALLLEHQWRHFTPQGHSRVFMLGFYLKLASMETKTSSMLFQDRHLEYMKISHGKSVRLDWLMLLILHFDFFLGFERYLNAIQSKLSFDALLSLLSDDEKTLMLSNLLAYASSINDLDFFKSLVD